MRMKKGGEGKKEKKGKRDLEGWDGGKMKVV